MCEHVCTPTHKIYSSLQVGKCIHDESAEVREAVVDTLATMGKAEVAAKYAVEITTLLHDEAEEVRVAVTRALGLMLTGPKATQVQVISNGLCKVFC